MAVSRMTNKSLQNVGRLEICEATDVTEIAFDSCTYQTQTMVAVAGRWPCVESTESEHVEMITPQGSRFPGVSFVK